MAVNAPSLWIAASPTQSSSQKTSVIQLQVLLQSSGVVGRTTSSCTRQRIKETWIVRQQEDQVVEPVIPPSTNIDNNEILPCSYTKVIYEFISPWFNLKSKYVISTPPKIHILIDHLEDYYN